VLRLLSNDEKLSPEPPIAGNCGAENSRPEMSRGRGGRLGRRNMLVYGFDIVEEKQETTV